jgi:hypothetical protein
MAARLSEELNCCDWLDPVQSGEGLQAVMHDITALLAMARRQPELNP